MDQAIVFGLLSSSALVIGAAIGSSWRPSERTLATVLAFAAGTLLAATSIELFGPAFRDGGALRSGLGLLAGSLTFVALSGRLEASHGARSEMAHRTGAGGLLLAATLDGIPESLALGVALVEESSVVLLVAIFAANLPEGLAGAAEMKAAGRSRAASIATWAAVAALTATAVVLGRVLLGGASPAELSPLLAFAGGAVLTAVATTFLPRAYEEGGPWVSMATASGFFAAYVLSAA